MAENFTVTKADLTERRRGQAGSVVRLVPTAPVPDVLEEPQWRDRVDGTYVVSFLFDRNGYAQPNAHVGIVAHLHDGGTTGFAWSVDVAEIAEVLR